MPWICSPDSTFGDFGLLCSEMPVTFVDILGDEKTQFVGGYPHAISTLYPGDNPALLVTTWDPRFTSGGLPANVNWSALRMVVFPADGHPAAPGAIGGTEHLFLSDLSVSCEYLASDSFLFLLRELVGAPNTWKYVLGHVTVAGVSAQRIDVAVPLSWLHQPSSVPPIGNVKLKIDGLNPNRTAIVSSHGPAIRVTIATTGATITAATTDFSSVLPNAFVNVRIDSLRLAGNLLLIGMTGWRMSGDSQGLILRLLVDATGATSRDAAYGWDGLWMNSLADYKDFRSAHLGADTLIGTAGSKLVTFGITSDGQSLDSGFGASGICEFDLGGTLADEAIGAGDRNGWMYLFAQRQTDWATVGARVRIASPSIPVPNGTIDPSFGSGGLVTLRADGYFTAARDIVFGTATIDVGVERTIGGDGPLRVPGMARLKFSDGSRDAAFGSVGVARHSGFSIVSLDANGSCVAATLNRFQNTLWLTWIDQQGDFVKARTMAPPPGTLQLTTIRVDPDGSTWVAGEADAAWVGKFAADGTPDANFGSSGFVSLRTADGHGIAALVGFRRDGSTVVKVGTSAGSFLCAVTGAGQVDQSFGQSGFTQIQFPTEIAIGFTVQNDDSVIFARVPDADPVVLGLGRITALGLLDATFGIAGGKGRTALPKTGTPVISITGLSIARILEADGKLYAIGTVEKTTLNKMFHNLLITRWNLDGGVDFTFAPLASMNVFGVSLHGDENHDLVCNAVTIDSAAAITLAGSAADQPAVFRLSDSGDLDLTFGTDGVCSLQLQEVAKDEALDVIVLPGRKIRIVCHTGVVQFALTYFRWPIFKTAGKKLHVLVTRFFRRQKFSSRIANLAARNAH